VAVAASVGLDVDESREVLMSKRYTDDVRADIAAARQIGVTGVPFYVFEDKYAVSGAQPPEVFEDVLRQVWEMTRPQLITLQTRTLGHSSWSLSGWMSRNTHPSARPRALASTTHHAQLRRASNGGRPTDQPGCAEQPDLLVMHVILMDVRPGPVRDPSPNKNEPSAARLDQSCS